MTGIIVDDIEAARDLMGSQRPGTMFCVADAPEGFLPRPDIILAGPRQCSPSAADLRFVKACGERLRVRLAARVEL